MRPQKACSATVSAANLGARLPRSGPISVALERSISSNGWQGLCTKRSNLNHSGEKRDCSFVYVLSLLRAKDPNLALSLRET